MPASTPLPHRLLKRRHLLQAMAIGGLALGCGLPLRAEPQTLATDSLLLTNFFGFGGNNASLVLQGCRAGETPCR